MKQYLDILFWASFVTSILLLIWFEYHVKFVYSNKRFKTYYDNPDEAIIFFVLLFVIFILRKIRKC